MINNSYLGNNNFICDTNQKRRLHPKCVKSLNLEEKQIEVERRKKKIKNLFENYNQKVTLDSESHREEYIDFVRNLRRNKPNDYWIYESYHYKKNPLTGEINPFYLKDNKKVLIKTQRQKVHINASKHNIIKNIKKIYFESKNYKLGRPFVPRNSLNILEKINELFERIKIIDKIEFNNDFDDFKNKIKELKKIYFYENTNNLKTKIKKYGRFGVLINNSNSLNKNEFLNEDLKNLFIKGENDLSEIFPIYIYGFLKDNGFIDESFEDSYYHQYTNRVRNISLYKNNILYNMYEEKINFLYDIINNSIDINQLTKKEFDNILINKFILEPVREYLFCVNYGLKNYFENKEYIFEIAFEDFYYLKLKINLHFLKKFMICKKKELDEKNFLGEGGGGIIYDFNNGKILKKSKESTYERNFFEYFKQLVLSELFSKNNLNNIIPKIYNFIIGKNEVYIIMEKIEGSDIIRFYTNLINTKMENINDVPNNIKNERSSQYLPSNLLEESIIKNQKIKSQIIFKDKIIKKIISDIGNIVLKYQKINFIHNDLNVRNILINLNSNEENIEYKIIDFDTSIINFNDIYIFNYLKQIDLNNIFVVDSEKNISLSSFIKSIDLFRFINAFFILPSYLKEYIYKNENLNLLKNKYDLSKDFKNNLRMNLFGTLSDIIPNKTNDLIKKYDILFFKKIEKSARMFFAIFFNVRKFVFDKFVLEEWKRKDWIKKYYMWIDQFIPENFIGLIDSININQNLINGGKKKSTKSSKTKSIKKKFTKSKK